MEIIVQCPYHCISWKIKFYYTIAFSLYLVQYEISRTNFCVHNAAMLVIITWKALLPFEYTFHSITYTMDKTESVQYLHYQFYCSTFISFPSKWQKFVETCAKTKYEYGKMCCDLYNWLQKYFQSTSQIKVLIGLQMFI